MYKLPLQSVEIDFIEKKSRFISNISPISSEDEALAFLNSIRTKYRDANHNVYAYRVKSGNITRYSDDGEPSGAAGMPLLEAFIRQDVYDFCCVATRYFGGTLLGAGGLVRAYARCGTIALESAGVGSMRELTLCSVSMQYSLFELVKRQLAAFGADITSEDFGADVVLQCTLPSDDFAILQKKIVELSAGCVQMVAEGTKMGVFR
ncbi:MAG: IMPACT family protein [Oscillospiraceae bacterium]|nr:IMPACT family protein [Oscillospiraceae bacterium]